ncbi:MFS transporter [Beijerinckia sp. L45]|uniref:MFS transporter n=1 Tax=Beijerinckia sp. L45 TaxID=1641855 RepID=UPI00131A689A|nr:MFS transporter [Beijerinckia sp. L45]
MQSLPRLSTKFALISFLLVCLTYVVNAMDRSVFPVLLPAVAKEYSFPLATGGLLATLFTLGLGIAGIPGGFLFDRLSRRAVAALGIVIYSVCTILTCVSIGFYDMAAYRVVSGVGEALQNVAIFTIAGTYFLSNRTLALGVLNVAYGAGSFIGPRWGSALMIESGNWHVPMYVFGVVGLIGAAIVMLLVSRRFSEQTGVVALRDSVEESHIPARLLNCNTVLLALVSVGAGLANFGYVGLYPTFLRTALHFSAQDAAAAASMYGVGALMGIPVGYLADRINQKALHLFALVMLGTVAYAIFNLATSFAAQEWLAFGEGMAASAILYVNGYSLMQRSVRASMVGRASGLYICCYYTAAAVSGYCFASLKVVFDNWGTAALVLMSGQLVIAFILMSFFDTTRIANRPKAAAAPLAKGDAEAV